MEPCTCVAEGDACSQCSDRSHRGQLRLDTSLELGHLFVLGDRYSAPLGLRARNAPVQMGRRCYGLGVSRMLGALFQLYGYSGGVLFPDAITTRDVVVLNAAKSEAGRKCAVELLDALGDVMVGVGRDA